LCTCAGGKALAQRGEPYFEGQAQCEPGKCSLPSTGEHGCIPGASKSFFVVSATISSYSSSELDMADVTDMAVGCCGNAVGDVMPRLDTASPLLFFWYIMNPTDLFSFQTNLLNFHFA